MGDGVWDTSCSCVWAVREQRWDGSVRGWEGLCAGEADAIFWAVLQGTQVKDRMGDLCSNLWEDMRLLAEYMGVWGVRMYGRKSGC